MINPRSSGSVFSEFFKTSQRASQTYTAGHRVPQLLGRLYLQFLSLLVEQHAGFEITSIVSGQVCSRLDVFFSVVGCLAM